MADLEELNEESEPTEAPRTYTVQEFFEQVAPGRDVLVEELSRRSGYDNNLILPDLGLFCESESCNGVRLLKLGPHIALPQKVAMIYMFTIVQELRKAGKEIRCMGLS